jgi:hypothetical protein
MLYAFFSPVFVNTLDQGAVEGLPQPWWDLSEKPSRGASSCTMSDVNFSLPRFWSELSFCWEYSCLIYITNISSKIQNMFKLISKHATKARGWKEILLDLDKTQNHGTKCTDVSFNIKYKYKVACSHLFTSPHLSPQCLPFLSVIYILEKPWAKRVLRQLYSYPHQLTPAYALLGHGKTLLRASFSSEGLRQLVCRLLLCWPYTVFLMA